MSTVEPGPPPELDGDLASRVAREIATLDSELAEIDMLVQQARIEADRHEQKRAQTAERLGAQPPATPAEDVATLNAQLVTLTRRAAVMEAQVEVLEGKRKALSRFREGLGEVASELISGRAATAPAMTGPVAAGEGEALPPATSRVILGAQEDLRRDIARAMHDGPAQSLTNIVLQAQIVERLVSRDPDAARGEIRQLVSMVQQTLDATKTFIFDVRPMVLDDLGLVPTLRRAARERGRRTGLAVDFESVGADRRLPMEIESGLFRMVDVAMAGFLAAAPDRVAVRLDWTDERIEARVTASRDRSQAVAAAEQAVADHAARAPSGAEVPAALAAMMAERRQQAEAAASAAREAAIVGLPPDSWREIQQRAATLGITTELADGGGELRIGVELAGLDEHA